MFDCVLVTGGLGFIGSNFTRLLLERWPGVRVVVLDKLTYAARLENVACLDQSRLSVVIGDIANIELVRHIVSSFSIEAVVNFAAETHVDRSLLVPINFSQTNVVGTHVLLEVAREANLRFHQVSTDEVYGDISDGQSVETDPLVPRSPYSASKAASDLMALAYFTSFGLRVTVSRGTNTIGPHQHLEKVVPLFATNALMNEPLPLYGDGMQFREYLHVEDHCLAIMTVLEKGDSGQIYNIGSEEGLANLEMARIILGTLNKPETLLQHVQDRPGHDRRYALKTTKMRSLGWTPHLSVREAIHETTCWYAEHEAWWGPVRRGKEFMDFCERQYSSRFASPSGWLQ